MSDGGDTPSNDANDSSSPPSPHSGTDDRRRGDDDDDGSQSRRAAGDDEQDDVDRDTTPSKLQQHDDAADADAPIDASATAAFNVQSSPSPSASPPASSSPDLSDRGTESVGVGDGSTRRSDATGEYDDDGGNMLSQRTEASGTEDTDADGMHEQEEDALEPLQEDAVTMTHDDEQSQQQNGVDIGQPMPNAQSDAHDGDDADSIDPASSAHSDPAASSGASSYRMPDIIKVIINRAEIELEAEADEEAELLSAARGSAMTSIPHSAPRLVEQVVYVQVIRDNLHIPGGKPFLGGFRHKYYGTRYHHAGTQTARKKKKVEVMKFHRESQTIQIISRSQQTAREASTQMERKDLRIDHSNDTIIMSRPYFTADELEVLRDNKARDVQCFLRQCFAWRRVRRLRETKSDEVARVARERALKESKQAEEHARQIQRRMHPRTTKDFAVLFAELESWRLHETARIKASGLTPEEVGSALQELLNKEVRLLQTIDRLKLTAARENSWARTQSSLEKMASPKEWSSSEGDLIEVETPFTTRAKELVDLYNGLCLRKLSRAQRVDVLLHIKYTVKEFDCELSREIVELIKREEDLLRRQRSEQSLEGCRKRMQNLFLQFVNTPHFNPEAANFQRGLQEAVGAAAGSDSSTAAVQAANQAAARGATMSLSSSLAKPSMMTKNNTITAANNVAGRVFAVAKKK